MDIDKTGEHAFSASADHTVRIWRIADGTCSKVTSHCVIVFLKPFHTETETAMIFLKKTVVKVVAVVKKSVVCMNVCMFCSFCCSVQGGPLVKTA